MSCVTVSDTSLGQETLARACPDVADLDTHMEVMRTRSSRQDSSRKPRGWKAGVALSSLSAGTVLILNLILTVWASVRYGTRNGIGDAYTGDCGTVSNAAFGLHLLINALSSILLSASNYTMQCVNSPTRSECDRAHSRGDWLDIGVVSIRNLSRIQWTRSLVGHYWL